MHTRVKTCTHTDTRDLYIHISTARSQIAVTLQSCIYTSRHVHVLIHTTHTRIQVLRDLIEQERQKILREAASKLGLEYMPRGVLQSKEDLELFRQGGGPAARR
jgi:hypothetical protein